MRAVLPFLLATATALPTLAQTANISLQKSADQEPVAQGATLTYTLTLSNEGPDDAQNVNLQDNLPAELTFQSMAAPAGWSCTTPAPGANGTIYCSQASFAPGSAVFQIVTTVGNVPDGTVFTNTATVTSTTSDPSPNDETSSIDTTVSGVPAVTVSITKSGAPDPVDAGADLTYTIIASNFGAVELESATVADTLPAATTFVSLTPPAGWSCTTPPPGTNGTMTCSIAPLPAATTATFTLVTHVAPATPAGTLGNSATFFSTAGGRDTTLVAAASTQVTAHADLSATVADAPDPVTPGQNLVYTTQVAQAGPSTATSVTLSDAVPAGTTFVSLAAPGGWSCTTPAAGATGTVACSIATLAPGSTPSFIVTVHVPSNAVPGTVINDTATTGSATPDPVPGNNSGNAATTVGPAIADLSVMMNDTPDPALAGSNIAYTITVTSIAGPSDAATSLSDTLPAGTTFVSLAAPGGWSCSTPAVGATGTVSCSGTLTPAASAVFTLTVKTNPSLAGGTIVSNTATATSAADSNNANNSATTTTTVNANLAAPAVGGVGLILLAAVLAMVAVKARS
jgi:uncharacterized repeat protein (TIGR01451 family)